MTLEETVFQKVKINAEKMLSFGFCKSEDGWLYKTDFCDGDFYAVLTVDQGLHLTGSVIERETNDEYLPLRIKDATGEFTYHVREEYLSLLKSVAVKIGTPVPFQSDQANRIAGKIVEKYGDAPDFPWREEEKETSDYGVFRHSDNEKWYALLMYTAESNLKTEAEKIAAKKAAEKEKWSSVKI